MDQVMTLGSGEKSCKLEKEKTGESKDKLEAYKMRLKEPLLKAVTLLKLHPDTRAVVDKEGRRSRQLRVDELEYEDGEKYSIFIEMTEETTADPDEKPRCTILVRHSLEDEPMFAVDSFTIIGEDMYQFGVARYDDFEKGVNGADLSDVEPLRIEDNLDDTNELEEDFESLKPINKAIQGAIESL